MNSPSIMNVLRQKYGDRLGGFLIPPPVFTSMEGEFITFDQEAGVLETRFPVLERFLNPYRSIQGGIIAAAVDNTLGPLSMLVAPPNVTRRLEIKYSSPITLDIDYFTVRGELIAREGQQLRLKADVRDPNGTLLARAQAMHWIID